MRDRGWGEVEEVPKDVAKGVDGEVEGIASVNLVDDDLHELLIFVPFEEDGVSPQFPFGDVRQGNNPPDEGVEHVEEGFPFLSGEINLAGLGGRWCSDYEGGSALVGKANAKADTVFDIDDGNCVHCHLDSCGLGFAYPGCEGAVKNFQIVFRDTEGV